MKPYVIQEIEKFKEMLDASTYTSVTKQEPVFSLGADVVKGQVPINAKGLSAVNLVKNGNFADSTKWIGTNVNNLAFTNNEAIFTPTAQFGNITQGGMKYVSNHTYYIAARVYGDSTVHLGISDNVSFTSATPLHSSVLGYELLSLVVTLNTVTPGDNTIFIRTKATSNFQQIKAKDVKCIDLTAIDLALKSALECSYMFPRYFDGLQGVNNVAVKSVGKNLVELGIGNLNVNGVSVITDEDTLIINGTSTGTSRINLLETLIAKASAAEIIALGYNIKTKKGVTYSAKVTVISGTNTGSPYITMVDKDSNVILQPYISGLADNGQILVDEISGVYLIFVGGVVFNNLKIKIQLEENTISTPYEPYVESISEIPTTLHSLPNGVKDEIVDGKLIKRVSALMMLDEKLNWSLGNVYGSNRELQLSLSNFYNYKANCLAFSATYGILPRISNSTVEVSWVSDATKFYIYLPTTIGSDIAAFKTWLTNNPVFLIYELATPIVEDLVTPLTVFPNGTISVESDVETTIPELTLTYPVNTAGAIERLNDATNQLSKIKADKVQEDWIQPTMVNGWTNVSGYAPFSYMKDSFGFVHVRGLVSTAVVNSALVIATLPVGYRPVVRENVVIKDSNGTAVFDITTAGEIMIASDTRLDVGISVVFKAA